MSTPKPDREDLNKYTGKNHLPKKHLLLKLSVVCLILLLGAAVTLPLVFSETQIIKIVENGYRDTTGLDLTIEDIDLKLLSGSIVMHNIRSTNTEGTEVISIQYAELNLSLSDLYDLYFTGNLKLRSFAVKQVRLTYLPYIQIINKILPHELTSDYNLAIAKVLDKSIVNIDYLQLEQESPTTIAFNFKGNITGEISGGGDISGKIFDLNKLDFSKVSVKANTARFEIQIKDTPLHNIFSGTAAYAEAKCELEGILLTQQSPLAIFHATPETKHVGKCTWDFAQDVITVPNVIITNSEGMFIKASGSITHPTEYQKIGIHADIYESLAPVPPLPLATTGLKLSLSPGFNFTGHIDIVPQQLDIKGKIKAENITLNQDSGMSLKANLTTDFHATQDSLLFENIEGKVGETALAGSTFIPTQVFAPSNSLLNNLKSLELNLDFNGKMQNIVNDLLRLGYYPEDALKPSGDFSLRLISKPHNTTCDLSLLFGSNDKNAVLLNSSKTRLPLGRFTGNLEAQLQSRGVIIHKASFKSLPLELNLTTVDNPTNQTYKIKFDLKGYLSRLLPLLTPELAHEFSTINLISLQGEGEYNLQTNSFYSDMINTKLQLTKINAPTQLTLNGPISLNATNKWRLELPESTINIINTDIISNKEQTGCSAILKLEADLLQESMPGTLIFAPTGNASLGVRSKNASMVNFFLDLFGNPAEAPVIDDTKLKALLKFTPETLNCSASFAAKNFAINKPVVFTDAELSGNTVFDYSIADKKIDVKSLNISSSDNSYSYSATGNFYIENAIFQGFNSKLTADLDTFFRHFKGYGEDGAKYEGNIEIISELIGTAESPTLTIVGKSNQIKITKYGYSELAPNLKFDAELSWNRDTDGSIYSLKAKEIFVKSAYASLYVTGNAERFKLGSSGVVDFGQGCDIDLILKGNRKLLWILIPGYYYRGSDIGNIDSIQLSAKLKASKLPLFSFENDLKLSLIDQIQISAGKLAIDDLTIKEVSAQNISMKFNLKDSILRVTDGAGQLNGGFNFASTTRLGDVPQGNIELNLTNIDLAALLSRTMSEDAILNGILNLPQDSPQSYLKLEWIGNTLPTILKSMKTKSSRAHIKDLVVEAPNRRIDWEEYLSVDFPPSLAKEISAQIDQKLAPTYGKRRKYYYKNLDITYHIDAGALNLTETKCEGGNTADLIIQGIVLVDGRLRLRIYPVKNINKIFDTRLLLQAPYIQAYIATLPPEQQQRVMQIIPSTLERLAREKKLFIEVTGTIQAPKVEVDNLKEEIRKSIPLITQQFKATVGEKGVLNLLLKNVKSEKLKKALGSNNGDSALQSGSSIGDLLKLIE